MTRRKLDKYQFSREAPNVIERGKPLYTSIKGKWNSEYFHNNHPITLELACGKGEYSIGLAHLFPNRNFIGVDIKGDRLARGSKTAISQNLENVAFLRASIKYLDEFFEDNEIDEIWIVHPDPHVRERDEKKRLTHISYLKQFERYLKPNGILHLKTDSVPLFEYSQEKIQNTNFSIVDSTKNLHTSALVDLHFGISTHYERVFIEKGFLINYLYAINKKGD